MLRLQSRQVRAPRLRVWADGEDVRVEARARWGRTLPVWLFRFEGDLRPTGVGTHVCGQVRRNWVLEGLLLAAGGLALLLAALSVMAQMSFVGLFAGLLVGLFLVYYGRYARLVQGQMRDLSELVAAWLTEPQGRASRSID